MGTYYGEEQGAGRKGLIKMSLLVQKLNRADGTDIYDFLQQLPAEENGFLNTVYGKSFEEYQKWLEGAVKSSERKEIIDGWKVPETVFWLMEDGKPVGYGKIRHYLTDRLREEGGNIGYSVLPQKRGKGLGSAFVSLLIGEADKMGIGELLFTVKNGNQPSIQAVLSNGGVIERQSEELQYIWVRTRDR